MTPKQREAIERHGRNLLAIFPNATERDPVKLCKKLRRLEVAASRHAERMCSDADYYNRWMEEYGDDQTPPHLGNACHLLGSERPWYNSDPRGYALKVDLRTICNVVTSRNPQPGTHLCRQPFTTLSGDVQGCPVHGIRSGIAERLHTDWGGYGILAPEIGPEGE